MNIIIEIATESDLWLNHNINEQLISKTLSNILQRHKNWREVTECELSILLTCSKHIAKLNNEFRQKNKPTNVLSFPDNEINPANLLEFKPDSDYMYLGDVAFAHEIIDEEAKNKAILFEEHFHHLLIHAILHLIGYDHLLENDASAMENLEIEILREAGIKNPYRDSDQ